jgi:two-component system chemotaxis response regulator CheY
MGTSIDFEALSFLIVDDSAYMRTILRTILSSFGARKIYEAEDGAGGLEKLNAYHPDIAIVDWEMPVLSGPEMIKLVRNPDECRHAFVPLILLTAHTERHRIIEARKFGVHEILRKPVSPKAIYQRIASIILHPRPFVRTATYFGPEPRDEIRAAEQKLDMTYVDKRKGDGKEGDAAEKINVDQFAGNAEEPEKKESAA